MMLDLVSIRWRPLVRLRVSTDCRPEIRVGGSDSAVFRQVFLQEHYASMPSDREVHTIVDCGANIGLSTLWFLWRYPSARVIAIEPDPSNFSLLAENVRAHEDRVTLIHGALWSRTCRLELIVDRARGEWATEVRECQTGSIEGVSMPDLLSQVGVLDVDVLKVDIEGGEREMFRGDASWLSRVGTLMIELHGAECESIVAKACDGRLSHAGRRGEISAWTRLDASQRSGAVTRQASPS